MLVAGLYDFRTFAQTDLRDLDAPQPPRLDGNAPPKLPGTGAPVRLPTATPNEARFLLGKGPSPAVMKRDLTSNSPPPVQDALDAAPLPYITDFLPAVQDTFKGPRFTKKPWCMKTARMELRGLLLPVSYCNFGPTT